MTGQNRKNSNKYHKDLGKILPSALLLAAEERLETMKCEGQTVCSLEVEVEINAYIQIADV